MESNEVEPRASPPALIVAEKSPVLERWNGYSRETVLLICAGLMLVLLALTAFISRMYHKDVHMLADGWFAKGEASFAAGNAAEAAKDYRNALVYSPGNPGFQLHLAQALISAGKYDEAQSYLLNLLAESPGSGEINLELARVAAHKEEPTSVQDALRYYYGAIYGVWETNPIQMRWNVRHELCEYLLSHGSVQQAQPEVIALSQDVPPGDIGRQKEAGALLLRVNLWGRALNEYQGILTTHKRDPDALAGAAVAAFEMHDYARASQYFDQLPRENRGDPRISAMSETAREAQAVNPFLPDLSDQERGARTARALERAESLARDCSQRQGSPVEAASETTALQKLWASLQQDSRLWSQRNLVHDPDQVDAAMEWVFEVEKAAAQECGEPSDPTDRALLLIAQSRAGTGP